MLNDRVLDGDHFYYMISYCAIIFHYKPERVSFPFFVNLFKRRYSIAMIFFKGQIFNVVSCGNYWKNKKKWQRGKLSVYHFRNTIIFFSQSCCFRRDCKANVCVMARCITYFTMLLELLIIKNVKCVGVMLSTEASFRSLTGHRVVFCRSSKETTPAPFHMTSGDASKLGSDVYSSVLLIHDKMSFFKKSALVWFCSKWGTLSCFDALTLAQNRDVDSCCEWIGPDHFNAQVVSACLKTINWHFIVKDHYILKWEH